MKWLDRKIEQAILRLQGIGALTVTVLHKTVVDPKCAACDGTGKMISEKTVTKFNGGSEEGMRLVLLQAQGICLACEGKGHA